MKYSPLDFKEGMITKIQFQKKFHSLYILDSARSEHASASSVTL